METKSIIPYEFELFNHKIKVKKYPALVEVGKYGDADYAACELRLFTNGCDPSVVEHSFYHELVHFLLHYAGRGDLADDEVLVDTLGGLLAQYEKTKR